jgi:hypothetical protein
VIGNAAPPRHATKASSIERGFLIAEPTVFPELKAFGRELVASVGAILDDYFCGAYLQGSFAVGDARTRSTMRSCLSRRHP